MDRRRTVFDLNDLQHDVFVPLPVYQREVGLVGRTTAAWVSTRPDDGATQQRVENQLRDTLNARGLRVGSTLTQETIRTQTRITLASSRRCCWRCRP